MPKKKAKKKTKKKAKKNTKRKALGIYSALDSMEATMRSNMEILRWLESAKEIGFQFFPASDESRYLAALIIDGIPIHGSGFNKTETLLGLFRNLRTGIAEARPVVRKTELRL